MDMMDDNDDKNRVILLLPEVVLPDKLSSKIYIDWSVSKTLTLMMTMVAAVARTNSILFHRQWQSVMPAVKIL